jgi:hypothetical protein
MPLNRRSALFTLAGLATVVAGSLLLCKPADAHQPHVEPMPSHYGSYSVTIERPGGGELPTYFYGGSRYVAGDLGSRYQIRVDNHSGRRIEAVVTVDGRDVVSGELGDYRKQRGYIVEPYGSVTVDGFRQSLDRVASFRFARLRDSYSARRGTPQHVGVVGVAVFQEYQAPPPRPRYSQPVTPYPSRPYYEPDPYPADEAAPAGKQRSGAGGASSEGAAQSAPHYRGDHDRYAPPARERIGTEYGESRHSSVREVSFRRKNKRRPDAVLTTYYDTLEGLRARGVPVDPYRYPEPYPHYDPNPFPEPGFAPPPPPRRY